MKKIALLFTIVCAGQLYGMEPMHPKNDFLAWFDAWVMEKPRLTATWQNLPTEVKSLIITSTTQNDNLDEAIKNIVRFSQVNKEVNKMLNSLEGFSIIVHMLSNKFETTPDIIAKKFKTDTARQYERLLFRNRLEEWLDKPEW